jgi:hypothetical protein
VSTFWFCNHSACIEAEALWLEYEVSSCEYHNIVSHISTNIDDILFEIIKIYLKCGVGFMDGFKESVSRDKSLHLSLAVVIVDPGGNKVDCACIL